MPTAEEKRLAVRNKYRTIIGRNYYSQARRNYCYTKYKNGKYYSDCSSSISHTYKQAGYSFGILNTVGMWTSKKLTDVPVVIKNGIIQNPEVLRIGDMLLFAGTDTGRSKYGYVGHVEMVGEISGKKVTLYGHGSGHPKKHEMNAYCKSRQSKKTKTKHGNKGLIRVRRFIQDDNADQKKKQEEVIANAGHVLITGDTVNIRTGCGTQYLILDVAKKNQTYEYMKKTSESGWHLINYKGNMAWVSGLYSKLIE